jgi:threonine-phosphate decarboxylase
MIHGHGGNIYDLARRLGCRPEDIVDMSSNVNPIGPPPGLMAHLQDQLELITRLPEVDAGEAAAAFARRHSVAPEKVIGANGTTQFIHILPRLLGTRRAAILGPTYADYGDACRLSGVPLVEVISDPATGFVPDAGEIDRAVRQGADTVFICNPNNPTGVLIPAAELKNLCRRHPDARFVVDESYLPFVREGEADSLMASGLPNLVVLSSMSKIFRVPGLRIGFAVAPENISRVLRSHILPWSVNALAQAAVNYLMTREPEISNFIRGSRDFLAAERDRLRRRLQGEKYFTLFDSTTSFVLVGLGGGLAAETLCAALADQRILIRDCSNFSGLSNRFVRISLKTPEANRTLAERLSAIASETGGDTAPLKAAGGEHR